MSKQLQTKTVLLNFSGETNKFKCKFLEAGVVSYAESGKGMWYISNETIEKYLDTFVGKPLQIGHSHDGKTPAVGVVTKAYYNPESKWYEAEGEVFGEEGKKAIARGFQVSCSYGVLDAGPAGSWHNVNYDSEVKALSFEHLALVEVPRYKGAIVHFNSMNIVKWVKKLLNNSNEGEQGTESFMAESTVDIGGEAVKVCDLINAYKEKMINEAHDKASEVEEKKEDTKDNSADEATETKAEEAAEDKKDNASATATYVPPAETSHYSDPAKAAQVPPTTDLPEQPGPADGQPAKQEPDLDNMSKAQAGHLGGVKGGPARDRALSADEKSSIAKKGADSRWNEGDSEAMDNNINLAPNVQGQQHFNQLSTARFKTPTNNLPNPVSEESMLSPIERGKLLYGSK